MFLDFLIGFGLNADRKARGDELTYAIPHTVGSFNSGVLMVCTPKAPEEIAYPVDFEGTVATVDAEAILLERLAVEPSPFGIASLGLFLKATGDAIKLDLVRESLMNYTRFSREIRKINVEAVEKVYEQTRVIHNHKIKGTAAKPADPAPAAKIMKGSTETTGALRQGLYSWRSTLPVCDQTKCVCIECLAAYYCPEAAINWQDEVIHIDYDFCKACGTCALECTENAITMEKSGKVLAGLSKK
jgi:2-oxoacid:acceptor oxidoreductase delta subunit (pyruvate/2-ketoisovalerate family)